MEKLYEKIIEARDFIQQKFPQPIEMGLILGSGLGHLAEEIKNGISIPFSQIPHFPVSTVAGHAGEMVLGELSGKIVAALKGRIHFYEGYTMKEITFPARVFKALQAKTLLVTNACGGINPSYAPGDLMIIEDHLNLMGDNPLKGPHDERLGVRFLDLSDAYDQDLIELALKTGLDLKLNLQKGVYAAVSGPTYETYAELEFLRRIGADTVGMSTIPEVMVARHGGMKVLGISCVTDVIHKGHGVSHEEVLQVAERTKPKFSALVKEILKRM